jgi:flavin reductase (DIM6/NTAB) family NADH-FMN oxidoreductase RutF
MKKIEVGPRNFMYPMPTTLVGAIVAGKPNYITIAHVGVMKYATLSVSLHKRHHTNAGIKESGTFSVNLPSARMVKETDYCGLVSGQDVDKAALFETFYGKLKTAPMIRECPVNMECKVIQTLDLGTHEIFIGDIVETYCSEECLTPGKGEDLTRVDPILFSMSGARYFRLGEQFALAWNAGKELNAKDVTMNPPPPAAKD